jgi:outer membrane protein OmpA-like peptidoglycan-associated protein
MAIQNLTIFLTALRKSTPLTRSACMTAYAIMTALFLNFATTTAQAQKSTPYYDLSTSEVSVDLSVLNDGGLGAPRTGAVSPSVGGGSLLMPGGRAPKSRLLVSPPRKPAARPRLRKPTKRKAAKKVRRTPQKVASKQKAAPKAAPKVPPKKITAPKQPEKPASTTVAKSAPPPPPPIDAAPKPAAKAPPPPVPAPAPDAPKPMAAPEPAKQQAAVQPTAPKPVAAPKNTGQSVLVEFGDTSAKVSANMKARLKKLAASIKGKDNLRLQLMAYAGGSGVSPSKARRLSLSRALSVRSYLISTGVRSTRIDVRALGNKTAKEPINRVDITIVKR